MQNDNYSLPYNLDNRDDRLMLTQKLRDYIFDASVPHKVILDEYNEIENRLNGAYKVDNFDNSSPTERAKNANDLTVNDSQLKPYWITVPRSRPNHESTISQFIGQRRSLIVSPRTFKDKTIAKIYTERIRYIEDVNNVDDSVYFPLIDGGWSKGLHWLHFQYDASRFGAKKFTVEEVSARDVLVDPRSRGMNFKTSRYRMRRYFLYKDEAKEQFKNYPYFDIDAAISGNKDYDIAYTYDSQDDRQQIVIYLIELKEKSKHYVFFNPQTRKQEVLSEEEFNRFSSDPTMSQFVVEIPGDDCYYYALYEEGNGVFYFNKSDINCFGLIPLSNFYTEQRLYPYGDIKMYQKLEDLLSMLVTLLNENVKRSNYPIVSVTPEMWVQYSKQIESAINHGGPAPGISGVHFPSPVNQGIIWLINSITGWIQDSAALHSASMGELPSKQIAKETVQALIAKDRQSKGRKDVMINLTLTELAKAMANAISVLDKDEDLIPISDPASSFHYLPINKIATTTEYNKMLLDIAEIKAPRQLQSPEELMMLEKRIDALKKEFEQTNDVEIVEVDGFIDEAGNEYMPETLLEIAQEEQHVDEPNTDLFFAMHPMVESKIKLHYINMLSPDVDLNVKYGVSSDFSSDPEYKANLAFSLKREGMISRFDFLNDIGVKDAKERIERADADNEVFQLAKQLTENPQMMEQIMSVLQQAQQPSQPLPNQGMPAQSQSDIAAQGVAPIASTPNEEMQQQGFQ